MSRIFISHSSLNNAAAIAINAWLQEQGWNDIFLDLEPTRGIVAGERWERRLHEAATRCEAVVFLVSKEWLASPWCLKEYQLASKLNKRLFSVIIDATRDADLPPLLLRDWQVVNLAEGTDHRLFRTASPNGDQEAHVTFSASGLRRLGNGLAKAGLDPSFYAWPPASDPDRRPYRGLRALDVEDAGIFFGREASVIAALDQLRGLREAAEPRLFVILGSSGAGKSSFLRAGLTARLGRDDRHFLAAPIIRPERKILSGENGVVSALKALTDEAKLALGRTEIEAQLSDPATAAQLLRRIVEARTRLVSGGDAGHPAPAVVLPIDQGEELFLAEAAAESESFLTLLRALLALKEPRLICIVAIRSDSYEKLQMHPALEGVRDTTFSLPTMPRGSFERVIAGPAARLSESGRRLDIEPLLIETLLKDLDSGGGKDALPLLAFTLERLDGEHGGAGAIKLVDYQATGGFAGAIRAAAEQAVDAADPSGQLPADRPARLALLRSAMVPWLAVVDPETRTPRRRVARLDEIPTAALELVERLVAVRLLVKDVAADRSVTVEPAHEALLRQWGQLKEWLDADAEALAIVEGVKRAAHEFAENDEAKDWLAHSGNRLAEAETISARPDLSRYLGEAGLLYLARCRIQDNADQEEAGVKQLRLARAQRWMRVGLVVATIAAVVAGGIAIDSIELSKTNKRIANAADLEKVNAEKSASDANDARRDAERIARELRMQTAIFATETARTLVEEGDVDGTFLLALQSAQAFTDETAPDQLLIALDAAVTKRSRVRTTKLPGPVKAFETDRALYLEDETDRHLSEITTSATPRRIMDGKAGDTPLLKVGEGRSPGQVIAVRRNGEVLRIDTARRTARVAHRFAEGVMAGWKRTLDEPTFDIIGGRYVVRGAFFSKGLKPGDANEKTKRQLQIADVEAGVSLTIEQPELSGAAEFGVGRDGATYLFAFGGVHAYRIANQSDRLGLQRVQVGAALKESLYLGECAKNINVLDVKLKNAMLTEFSDMKSNRKCSHRGNVFLYSYSMMTSAGEDVTYNTNFNDSEDMWISFRERMEKRGGARLTTNNLTWAGISPGGKSLATLANRDVIALDEEETHTHRHQSFPASARFVSDMEVVSVEEEAGRLTSVDLRPAGEILFLKKTATNKHSPDAVDHDDKTPIPVLNVSTCKVNRLESEVLKIGDRVLSLTEISDGATLYGEPVRVRLTISDAGKARNVVVPDVLCASLSNDGGFLTTTSGNGVRVFRLDQLSEPDKIAGGPLVELPTPGIKDAFYIPASDRLVLRSEGGRVSTATRSAGRWILADAYRSGDPLIGIEPDATGKRIIVTEGPGGGMLKASLYSLTARRVWMELGSEYKWLGPTFAPNGEITVSKRSGRFVHPVAGLAELRKLAEEGLSVECQPREKDKYQTSPCWPALQ
jgi:hypothetical protein